MHHHATDRCPPRPGASRAGSWLSAWLLAGFLALTLALPTRADASVPELTHFDIARSDEGWALDFAVQFELPRGVEEALLKGVPLHFVADAALFRERWYWRDREINRVTRTWRLAYQPLTRAYRVSFGGLNQSFESLTDAVAAVRRISRWKLAEPGQIDDGASYYVEFSYKLDTTLLPRPMQIGIGDQPEWTLQIEKIQRLPRP